VSVCVLGCAYLCFKCQEIARELVLLREQMAACQASEAKMEAGLSSKAMEATIWQASSLAGVAYALVQHVARPLWVRHFETDFPLDRLVLPTWIIVCTIILFYINLLDVGVQALQLGGGAAGPTSLQLPGASPAEGFCLHCLHSARSRGEFMQKSPPFWCSKYSEWAPILTCGGMYVARTYTRKHRPGVHARALPPT
jgi:hypothetical protein